MGIDVPGACSERQHQSPCLGAFWCLQCANSHAYQLPWDLPRQSQNIPLAHVHWCFAAEDEQRCSSTSGFSGDLASALSLFWPFLSPLKNLSSFFLPGPSRLWRELADLVSSDEFLRISSVPYSRVLWAGWLQDHAWVSCLSHPFSLGECPLDIHNLSSSWDFLFYLKFLLLFVCLFCC